MVRQARSGRQRPSEAAIVDTSAPGGALHLAATEFAADQPLEAVLVLRTAHAALDQAATTSLGTAQQLDLNEVCHRDDARVCGPLRAHDIAWIGSPEANGMAGGHV